MAVLCPNTCHQAPPELVGLAANHARVQRSVTVREAMVAANPGDTAALFTIKGMLKEKELRSTPNKGTL